jgi:tRNA dimethylallyltransferase
MQVYRGMDIGTAKPTPEDRARVPHHLVDMVDPEEDFTVARFQSAGRSVLAGLDAAGVPALVAGGSGLHFRALVDPLDFPPSDAAVRALFDALDPEQAAAVLVEEDPGAADHVDLGNPRRVTRALEIMELTGATPSQRAVSPAGRAVRSYEAEIPVAAVGLDPGDGLEERVRRRTDAMLAAGLLDEVRRLGSRLGLTARQAVGYKELLPVVAGEATLDEGREAMIRATLALAKRQRTYFRRDPRIRWLAWHDDPDRRAGAAEQALGEAVPWIS